jgi:hypothetical protein
VVLQAVRKYWEQEGRDPPRALLGLQIQETPLHVPASSAGPPCPERAEYHVRQLQVAVHSLPKAAVTGPAPTKSALKKKNVGLANENGAFTALSAELQSAIDGKVCT